MVLGKFHHGGKEHLPPSPTESAFSGEFVDQIEHPVSVFGRFRNQGGLG